MFFSLLVFDENLTFGAPRALNFMMNNLWDWSFIFVFLTHNFELLSVCFSSFVCLFGVCMILFLFLPVPFWVSPACDELANLHFTLSESRYWLHSPIFWTCIPLPPVPVVWVWKILPSLWKVSFSFAVCKHPGFHSGFPFYGVNLLHNTLYWCQFGLHGWVCRVSSEALPYLGRLRYFYISCPGQSLCDNEPYGHTIVKHPSAHLTLSLLSTWFSILPLATAVIWDEKLGQERPNVCS